MKHQRQGGQPARRDRLIRERIHDPYKLRSKLAEPSHCTDCGAVYRAGRWIWGTPLSQSEGALCPACARIRDHQPAGFLTLAGNFFAEHRDEVLRLARNHEAREKAEHPLERIMAVAEQADGSVLLTTTDAHLARGIGEAVEDAYDGESTFKYNEEDCQLTVHWRRD